MILTVALLVPGTMYLGWWLMVAAALASAAADEASDPEGLLEPVAGKWDIADDELFYFLFKLWLRLGNKSSILGRLHWALKIDDHNAVNGKRA